MSRRETTTAKLLFGLFMLLSIYTSGLIGAKSHTRLFVAFTTLAWHLLANIFCAKISSYRFKNPGAKYINIKNKFIRNIFVRPFTIGDVAGTDKSDDRINIIGLVLNILNTLFLVSFEVLLFMPPIPCEPYHYLFPVKRGPGNYSRLCFELHSFNEIIPAEGSRAFAIAVALMWFVFMVLLDRRLKEHREYR